jgi:hypothetical protein
VLGQGLSLHPFQATLDAEGKKEMKGDMYVNATTLRKDVQEGNSRTFKDEV